MEGGSSTPGRDSSSGKAAASRIFSPSQIFSPSSPSQAKSPSSTPIHPKDTPQQTAPGSFPRSNISASLNTEVNASVDVNLHTNANANATANTSYSIVSKANAIVTSNIARDKDTRALMNLLADRAAWHSKYKESLQKIDKFEKQMKTVQSGLRDEYCSDLELWTSLLKNAKALKTKAEGRLSELDSKAPSLLIAILKKHQIPTTASEVTESRLKSMEDSLQARFDKRLQEKLAEQEANFARELREQVTEKEAKFAKNLAECETRITRQMAKQLAANEAKLDMQVVEIESRINKQMAEKETTLRKQMEENKLKLNEQVASTSSALDKQAADANVRLGKQIASHAAVLGKQLSNNETLIEKKMTENESKLMKQIAENDGKLMKKIAESESNLSKQISDNPSQPTERIPNNEIKFSQQVIDLEAKLGKHLAENVVSLQNEIAKTGAKLREVVEANETKMVEMTTEKDRESITRAADSDAQIKRKFSEIDSQHDNLKADLARCVELERSQSKQQNTKNGQFEDSLKTLSARVSEVMSATAEVKLQVVKQIAPCTPSPGPEVYEIKSYMSLVKDVLGDIRVLERSVAEHTRQIEDLRSSTRISSRAQSQLSDSQSNNTPSAGATNGGSTIPTAAETRILAATDAKINEQRELDRVKFNSVAKSFGLYIDQERAERGRSEGVLKESIQKLGESLATLRQDLAVVKESSDNDGNHNFELRMTKIEEVFKSLDDSITKINDRVDEKIREDASIHADFSNRISVLNLWQDNFNTPSLARDMVKHINDNIPGGTSSRLQLLSERLQVVEKHIRGSEEPTKRRKVSHQASVLGTNQHPLPAGRA
jgi:hypothetical protein